MGSPWNWVIPEGVKKLHHVSETRRPLLFLRQLRQKWTNYHFFNVNFRKDLRRKPKLKLPPPLKSVAAIYLAKYVINYSYTAQLIQFKVVQIRLITVNIHEDVISLFVDTDYLPHVFKMSAFITYSCFEW